MTWQDEEVSGLVERMQQQAEGMYTAHAALLGDLGLDREDFFWCLECVSTRAFFRDEQGVTVRDGVGLLVRDGAGLPAAREAPVPGR